MRKSHPSLFFTKKAKPKQFLSRKKNAVYPTRICERWLFAGSHYKLDVFAVKYLVLRSGQEI